jgi:coenzyme F420-0:L-glutamate ligase / coenzyme F420-1:gamma-L-glutamate ligase
MVSLTGDQFRFVQQQRVARLATADQSRQPHIVPACYACHESTFYIALDSKPKRVPPQRLTRVRNILDNPRVALLIDRYSDDWNRLAYLLIRGEAALLMPDDSQHASAITLLRDRYRQYVAMPIHEQPVITIRPTSIVAWGALDSEA